MLTCDKFTDIYWAHYISLEREFVSTLHFVPIDPINSNTFSEAYSKLILGIGSEVDVVLKEYCKMLQPAFSGETIDHYRVLISTTKPDFCTQDVLILKNGRKVKPWLSWNGSVVEAGHVINNPHWWKIYNKVKHERTEIGTIALETKEYYKFATQDYTLLALAGLYQVLIYIYYELATAEGKQAVTPLPGSRIFELTGHIWNANQFYRDIAVYVENGELVMESGNIYY